MILAWFGKAFHFIANSKPAQYALMFIGAILAFKTVQMKARMDGEKIGREKAERKHAEQQAETRAEIVERTSEIIHEERQNADAALEARDAGSAPASFDELPESHKALARRRAAAREQSGG